jgi:hypothetical protein
VNVVKKKLKKLLYVFNAKDKKLLTSKPHCLKKYSCVNKEVKRKRVNVVKKKLKKLLYVFNAKEKKPTALNL